MGAKLPYKMLANVALKKPGRLVDGVQTDNEGVVLDGSRESAGEHGGNREEQPVIPVFSADVPRLSAETTTRERPRTVRTEEDSCSSSSGH